jgi:hypothetical protein
VIGVTCCRFGDFDRRGRRRFSGHTNAPSVTVDAGVAAVLAIGAEVVLAAPVSGCR